MPGKHYEQFQVGDIHSYQSLSWIDRIGRRASALMLIAIPARLRRGLT
jgi:hypothetical protein